VYVVAKRWKIRDINGQLRKEGERVELSDKDVARLLKTGVILKVSYYASDDDPVNGGGEAGGDHDDGKSPDDEDVNDADDISTDEGDIPLPEAGTEGDGEGKRKPKARRGG
jgi:hypothetical protein